MGKALVKVKKGKKVTVKIRVEAENGEDEMVIPLLLRENRNRF